VVVALAGGTGSGKSSLLNAIAGEEVAETGAIRPVTSRPLAWIPADPEPGLTRLLDAIGIDERVGHRAGKALAVIDLPDTDSIEETHRQIVARLVPEVDAVVWVMDPEKYHDRILHEEHLQPLAEYQGQFLFALNQVDRLGQAELASIMTDLESGLRRDGIERPRLLAVAADPPVGPPQGIDELLGEINGMGDAKEVVLRKLIVDCRGAARRLADAAELSGGAGTGFVERWNQTVGDAADHLAGGIVAAAARELKAHGARSAGAAVGMGRASMPAPPELGSPTITTVAAATLIRDCLQTTGERAGGESRRRLAAIEVDEAVQQAAASVARIWSVSPPQIPSWMKALGWIRRLAVLAIVLAIAWAFDRERLFGPALVVAVAGVLVVGIRGWARRHGAGLADAGIAAQSERLSAAISAELDRRIGREARAVLRERAEATTALAEFELVMRALE
jgi:GTP-binding protein EngB required for normal cell division